MDYCKSALQVSLFLPFSPFSIFYSVFLEYQGRTVPKLVSLVLTDLALLPSLQSHPLLTLLWVWDLPAVYHPHHICSCPRALVTAVLSWNSLLQIFAWVFFHVLQVFAEVSSSSWGLVRPTCLKFKFPFLLHRTYIACHIACLYILDIVYFHSLGYKFNEVRF